MFRTVFGWPLSWFRGCETVLTSSEFKALGKSVLNTDPLGALPRWLLQRSPGLGGLSRVVGEGATGTWLETLAQPKPRYGIDFGMGAVCSARKIFCGGHAADV